MSHDSRTRAVTDVDGDEWTVRVIVAVHRADGFAASADDLREVLPGPVRERLIDDLRDDVERML